MSLYDAINNIAVYNPDIFALAHDYTYENFTRLGNESMLNTEFHNWVVSDPTISIAPDDSMQTQVLIRYMVNTGTVSLDISVEHQNNGFRIRANFIDGIMSYIELSASFPEL